MHRINRSGGRGFFRKIRGAAITANKAGPDRATVMAKGGHTCRIKSSVIYSVVGNSK